MSGWQVVGQQRFRVQDDTVYCDIQGDVTAVELVTLFGSGLAVQKAYGYALFLIVIKGQWSFPPAARESLAQFHRQHKAVGATAVVGINPTMRLFIDLVLRAIGLVSGRRPPTRFFDTSAAALDWVAEQRALGKQGLLSP